MEIRYFIILFFFLRECLSFFYSNLFIGAFNPEELAQYVGIFLFCFVLILGTIQYFATDIWNVFTSLAPKRKCSCPTRLHYPINGGSIIVTFKKNPLDAS